MRARCISNEYRILPPTSMHYHPDSGNATFSYLQVDNEYVIYSIWESGKELLFSVLESEDKRYPNWLPSNLFEIVDRHMPSCWRFKLDPIVESKPPSFLIAFDEWVDDSSFYANVVDGCPAAQAIWQRYRREIADESR